MKKIFWENPYQRALSTKVDLVKGDEVLFDETIIYSFSGGQESDSAFIDDKKIISSRMEGPLIFYTLGPDHGLFQGKK